MFRLQLPLNQSHNSSRFPSYYFIILDVLYNRKFIFFIFSVFRWSKLTWKLTSSSSVPLNEFVCGHIQGSLALKQNSFTAGMYTVQKIEAALKISLFFLRRGIKLDLVRKVNMINFWHWMCQGKIPGNQILINSIHVPIFNWVIRFLYCSVE